MMSRLALAGLAAAVLLLSPVRAAALEFERCRVETEIPGSEDFALDLESAGAPRLLVSAQDRRNDRDGGLWSVPLTPTGLGPPTLVVDAAATGRGGCPLRPHGVSLAEPPSGPPLLYVIVHMEAADQTASCQLPRSADGETLHHSIEVYRVEADALRFQERIADPILSSPNDLTALGDGNLYVTNETTYRGLLRGLAELLGLWTSSYVAHFDGRSWRVAVTDVRYANGIAVDRSGRKLLVGGVHGGALHVYPRDPASGGVGLPLQTIEIGSGVDNLLYGDASRGLTLAAHPSMFAYLRHLRDPESPSPTEIWEVDVEAASARKIHENDGSVLQAGSVAVIFDGRLYAGQVFNRGLMVCERRP